ncbi:MAG TPA: nuclear transport factor 2 family protein [Stellaceae bacterium]|nr:nuclear transport factor 2 family protein [Stellaceae bacterium]
MSAADNKALALEYMRLLEKGDYDAAFGKFAPDGQVTVMGRTSSVGDFAKVVREFRGMVTGPMTLKPTSTIGEGEKVAMEVTGGADMIRGVRYDNQYHFAFEFKNGKITHLKEYMDTAKAQATWEALGKAAPEKEWK